MLTHLRSENLNPLTANHQLFRSDFTRIDGQVICQMKVDFFSSYSQLFKKSIKNAQTHTHMYICLPTYLPTYLSVSMDVCMLLCIYKYIYLSISLYIYTYIYIYIYIYTYIYIYIYIYYHYYYFYYCYYYYYLFLLCIQHDVCEKSGVSHKAVRLSAILLAERGDQPYTIFHKDKNLSSAAPLTLILNHAQQVQGSRFLQ